MGGNGKHRTWKISFRPKPKPTGPPPKEFLCPITGSLMFDPVVISSGQTFDRLSLEVSRDLNFAPPSLLPLPFPDLSNPIPNLAMKSTILSWCTDSGVDPPSPPDYSSVADLIRSLKSSSDVRVSDRQLLEAVADHPSPTLFSHAATEVSRRVNHFYSDSSEESVVVNAAAAAPLPLATRPACCSSSSSSSSENETLTLTDSSPEGEIILKLNSSEVHEQESGAILLRKVTRASEYSRISLCTRSVLASLKPLIISRYAVVQTNALAALVNLSLERSNKLTVVRSGFVPLLVDVLKSGSGEAQEHAAGALFSLALEDENKMAIGVLGALQPLMHTLLRSESEGARHDSVLALYHLSLVQSNRAKLVKLGAVPMLLGMVKTTGKVLLVLCNLAACNEGRAAMLDANAVGMLVGMLRDGVGGESVADSESTRENCVAALFALSHGSMRFKGLAKEARAVEVLREIEERGSQRAREKAKRILMMMREQGEGGAGGEWDGRLDPGGLTRARYRVPVDGPNSSNF